MDSTTIASILERSVIRLLGVGHRCTVRCVLQGTYLHRACGEECALYNSPIRATVSTEVSGNDRRNVEHGEANVVVLVLEDVPSMEKAMIINSFNG